MLIVIGAISGILGVLFALAQHDIKRLLAYHSVENIGIITLGMGIGLLGVSAHNPLMAMLGFSGAVFHVLNHTLFKGLLFLSAGSVVHACHVRDMEELGGLQKRMPITGTTFLVGSAAISGLPPFNGFVSEFFIFMGALTGIIHASTTFTMAGSVVTIAALALIGGLALACFTKAFGIMFLGEPRSTHATHAHEVSAVMWMPMIILATLCLLLGIGGPFLLPLLATVIAPSTGLNSSMAVTVVQQTPALHVIWKLTAATGGFMVLVLVLSFLRKRLLSGRKIHHCVTWDCGYIAPTARMQYTASSFAAPIIRMFGAFLGTRSHLALPEGLFPKGGHFASDTPDVSSERLYAPLFARLEALMARVRLLQHGLLHLYILMIVLSLLGLLFWKLG